MNNRRAKQIRQDQMLSEKGTTNGLTRTARRNFSRNGLIKSQNPKLKIKKLIGFPKLFKPLIKSWIEKTGIISKFHSKKDNLGYTIYTPIYKEKKVTRVICK